MRLNNIINFFIEQKLLANEDAELVKFGLKQGIFLGINILIILFIGGMFHEFLSSICFLVCFIVLRSYAGGYHAKTAFRCFVISVFIIILVFAMIHFLSFSTNFLAVIIAISFLILWEISPVDNENRVLDNVEKSVYRRISHYVLCMEVFIASLCGYFDKKNLLEAVTMALLVSCILASFGKLTYKFKRK